MVGGMSLALLAPGPRQRGRSLWTPCGRSAARGRPWTSPVSPRLAQVSGRSAAPRAHERPRDTSARWSRRQAGGWSVARPSTWPTAPGRTLQVALPRTRSRCVAGRWCRPHSPSPVGQRQARDGSMPRSGCRQLDVPARVLTGQDTSQCFLNEELSSHPREGDRRLMSAGIRFRPREAGRARRPPRVLLGGTSPHGGHTR